MLGADLILPPSLVGHPAFSYAALGHVHKHQVLQGAARRSSYPGSVDRIDFGEEKDEKGFVLVELKGREASWQFIRVHARPFISIHAEANSDDPTMDVVAAIQATRHRGAIVRLIIDAREVGCVMPISGRR